MDVDLTRSRWTPYQHQRIGVEKLVENPYFFITDDPGAGKSKQVIDAAQVLHQQGVINRVIILAPAAVVDVWIDEDLGELRKHLWNNTNNLVSRYHGKISQWRTGTPDNELKWIVSNYEFLRSKERLQRLMQCGGPKTLLVCDESSAVKGWLTQQTKAVRKLRKKCGRVILLNGTPISNSPADLFSQGNILSPTILECTSRTHFRSRYGVLGGWMNKQVVKWTNLEDLQQRFAPFVLRRLKKDCLDLPEKLPPVTFTVPLTKKTWGYYTEMRDEMVAWLNVDHVSAATVAITKIMRLSQITSGFIGGVEDLEGNNIPGAKEIGREKLDFLLQWWMDQLGEDPNFKLLVWCRFKPELMRLLDCVRLATPEVEIGSLVGGQKKEDRLRVLHLLHPETAPPGPVFVGGTYGTGSKGLNLSACHTVFNMSYDYSLEKHIQSEDRVHRPGQVNPVSYYDLMATGPDGQRTIDHGILKIRRNKENIADFTMSAWLQILRED